MWVGQLITLTHWGRGPINNIPPLVQIMAWRRPGEKQSSEPIVVRLPMHICIYIWVSRPQWINKRTHTYVSVYSLLVYNHWQFRICLHYIIHDRCVVIYTDKISYHPYVYGMLIIFAQWRALTHYHLLAKFRNFFPVWFSTRRYW